jgi:hypothetical protein
MNWVSLLKREKGGIILVFISFSCNLIDFVTVLDTPRRSLYQNLQARQESIFLLYKCQQYSRFVRYLP